MVKFPLDLCCSLLQKLAWKWGNVCAVYRAQVLALFSSRQAPSAHQGGFPNNSIVKIGGIWETWLQYKHGILYVK